MKDVTLKQLTRDELKVLQSELELYGYQQELGLSYWTAEEFLNAVTAVDISMRLWYALRKKLESNSTYFSVKLKLSEAVILYRCCLWQRTGRSEYQNLITGKYARFIDHELTALTTPQPPRLQ